MNDATETAPAGARRRGRPGPHRRIDLAGGPVAALRAVGARFRGLDAGRAALHHAGWSMRSRVHPPAAPSGSRHASAGRPRRTGPARAPAAPQVVVGLNAVIVAVTGEAPRVLTVTVAGEALADRAGRAAAAAAPRAGRLEAPGALDALPFGPLDPAGDRTLELALRRWVRAQTGIEFGYVEQLYTFGDRLRDPGEAAGGRRVVSVAYLALVREGQLPGARPAQWLGIYEFFPWEDWRDGRPAVIAEAIASALGRWARGADDGAGRAARQERAEIAFGLGGARWDGERVLERYELLYEVGLVAEARESGVPRPAAPLLGRPMALDHRRILATALGRLRGKLKYRPVVFELLPESFTLLQLQRAVEALAGVRLHKQNFRRLVEQGGLVEGTGRLEPQTGGRPAERFRFRREVLRERPAPGVGLPGARRGG